MNTNEKEKKIIIFSIISAVAAVGAFIIALIIKKLTINNILVATLTVAGIFVGVMFCVYLYDKIASWIADKEWKKQ